MKTLERPEQLKNYYSEATDAERKEFRKWVNRLLYEQEVLLELIAADGTDYQMKCTLSDLYGAKYKPEMLLEKTESVSVDNDTCPVWDINTGKWSSFRWDQLKKINLPKNKVVHQHGKISTVVTSATFYQNDNISIVVSYPSFYRSVVEFINNFGNLYYGTMNTELFYRHMKITKQIFLSDLKNIDKVETQQPIAFKLYLCRVAMKEPWRFPSLINENESMLNWHTGQGRFLATIMCQPDPHLKLKFLLLQHKHIPEKRFLQSPIQITTDQQLHEILDVSNNSSSTVTLGLQVEQYGSHLALTSLSDGDQSHHYDVGTPYLEQFKLWQQTYGPRPVLHIYTDWPELITDSENVWTINHQGNSIITKSDDFKLGYLERQLFNQIDNPVHGADHVLYVTEPRPIDVSDFLCWVDLTYSAYVSCHGQFALFRPTDNYISTLVDISYINNHMNNSIRRDIELLEASTRPAKLETTPLSYSLTDLEPVLSENNLVYHFEHLAKNYAKRYNAGEGDADFNRAGSFLHNKLFSQFRSPKGANRPKGAIAQLIEHKFKTYEDFQAAFKEEAMKIQGSGWIYLSTSGEIKTIKNHAVRVDIALIIDWWEHAMSDYLWNKEKYLDNMWKIIDWSVINERI
jgi:Fe-Mn family superoxide dismutase